MILFELVAKASFNLLCDGKREEALQIWEELLKMDDSDEAMEAFVTKVRSELSNENAENPEL